ncbi:MAG: hypothetical protein M3O22_03380 [Pseudomonadota bacterium]|nr:hypothetical protein [Pseudomonadota bacterium]
MAIFLSTYTNKVDRKGRVSVPSLFRSELSREADQSVVVFPSLQHQALECCSRRWLEDFSANLDHMDLPAEDKDILATTIFGGSVALPMDTEGRILLPGNLLDFAGLTDQAAFFGAGATFQIWEPSRLAARSLQARDQARARNISLRMIRPGNSNTGGGRP